MPRYEAWIPDYRVGELRARIEQIEKRARRLKVEPPTLEVFPETRMEKFLADSGGTVPVLVRRVAVSGEPAMIQGWEVAAVVHHTEDFNLVHSSQPEIGQQYREADPDCEHCNTHRQRNKTVVLRNEESGELKQIGSTCLGDFTGAHNPEHALAITSFLHEAREAFEESCGYGPSRPPEQSTRAVIAQTAMLVRKYGYVSRKAADIERKVPTVEQLRDLIEGRAKGPREVPSIADLDLADRAIEWVSEQPDDGGYMGNLQVATMRPFADDISYGLVASSIPSFRRHLEKQTEREMRTAAAAGHLGQEKQRLEFEADVLSKWEFDGLYGLKTFLTMRDDAGHNLIWKASGALVFERGDRVRGKGTVKEHGEYKGLPQTVLSRCALQVVATAAERQAEVDRITQVWRDEATILAERPELAQDLQSLFFEGGRYLREEVRVERAERMMRALHEDPEVAPVEAVETVEAVKPSAAEAPEPNDPNPVRAKQMSLF